MTDLTYDISLEARVAVLETKIVSMGDDVTAIRIAIERMSGDVGQLTQITAIGKAAWRFLMWSGLFVSGVITLAYMVLSIYGSWQGPVPIVPSVHITTPGPPG